MSSSISTKFEEAALRRVHRGRDGKWIFCLAEYNHAKWPQLFKLIETTAHTTEAAARLHFSTQLNAGNHFLIKVPERVAGAMKYAAGDES
jgi:hypothetical protein